MEIEFKVSEIIETKDGVHFKHYTEKKEYPDDGRHSELCVVCGFPSYPECREWCSHEGYAKYQDSKAE